MKRQESRCLDALHYQIHGFVLKISDDIFENKLTTIKPFSSKRNDYKE